MLCGHKKNDKYFDKILKNGNLAHAYLLVGPEGVGKTFFARNLASKIICGKEDAPCGSCSDCRLIGSASHPDLITLRPEIEINSTKKRKKFISIDQVRQLQKKLSLFAYQSNKKVVLVCDAEFISLEAANAFLKILEEPPADTVLILISSYPDYVLPTIISRCQIVNFGFLNNSEMEVFTKTLPEFQKLDKNQQALLRVLASGRPGFLLKFMRQEDLFKELFIEAKRFSEILNGNKAEALISLKGIEQDFQKVLWKIFVWLSLAQNNLSFFNREQDSSIKKFLSQNKDLKKLVFFSNSLLKFYQEAKNPSLNHRLLLENLILQT